MLCFSAPAAAYDQITILVSQNSPSGHEFAKSLKSGIVSRPEKTRHVQILPLPANEKKWSAATSPLVIAVGVQAFQDAARNLDTGTALVGVLIPQASYARIRAQAPPALRATAIFLDQPIPRQIALIRRILPQASRLGVLLGPENRHLQPSLSDMARATGIELQVETIAQEEALVPALKQTLDASDALLALPDPMIFSRETAQTILLTSYRHQTPVIGFSRAYVAAGALAAVYSTPEQIARQAAELIAGLDPQNTALPSPQSPTYFSVAVNTQVARSLGIAIENAEALTYYLQQYERGTP